LLYVSAFCLKFDVVKDPTANFLLITTLERHPDASFWHYSGVMSGPMSIFGTSGTSLGFSFLPFFFFLSAGSGEAGSGGASSFFLGAFLGLVIGIELITVSISVIALLGTVL
jgi:hypothetical protein